MASALGLAAYGSYGATPADQALLMRRRMFPYQWFQNPDTAAETEVQDYRRGGRVRCLSNGGDANDNAGSTSDNPGGFADSAMGQGISSGPGMGDVGTAGGVADAAFGRGLMGLDPNSRGVTAFDAQHAVSLGYDQSQIQKDDMQAAGYGPLGKTSKGLAGIGGKAVSMGLGMAGVPGMAAGLIGGIAKSGLDAAMGKSVTGRDVATNVGMSSTPMGLGMAMGYGIQNAASLLGFDPNPSPAPHGQTSPAGMDAVTAPDMAEQARRRYLESQGTQGLARGGIAGIDMIGRLMRGSGLVPGASGGRADKIRARLPKDAYVFPADVVSFAGQGNTLAGAKRIGAGLKRLPRFAAGGDVEPVDVMLSGGEFSIHPHHVAAIGGGSMKVGHAALDRVVQMVRQRQAQQAASLPPPR